MVNQYINVTEIFSLLPQIRGAYNLPQELLQQPNGTATVEGMKGSIYLGIVQQKLPRIWMF